MAVIGASGVIVGALINTALSVWNSTVQRKLDAALAVRQEKVNQYFEALDTLYSSRDELQSFGSALSGLGMDEDKRKSILPWRNRNYRDSDVASASAFVKLDAVAQRVAIQRARIDVIGSPEAADAFESCYEIIFDYLREVAEQVADDGLFRAQVWEEYWSNYNDQITETLEIFRRDVAV